MENPPLFLFDKTRVLKADIAELNLMAYIMDVHKFWFTCQLAWLLK